MGRNTMIRYCSFKLAKYFIKFDIMTTLYSVFHEILLFYILKMIIRSFYKYSYKKIQKEIIPK